MMGWSSRSTGDTEAWLKKLSNLDFVKGKLTQYAEEGVSALRAATPVDSGVTAASWTYEIIADGKSFSIIWGNTNVVAGTPVAILLQHGHGTGTGGYVEGRDYINPVLQPLFDRISNDVWKAVTQNG